MPRENAGQPLGGDPLGCQSPQRLELQVLNDSSEDDFNAGFCNLIQMRAGGLVITADTLFSGRSAELAALTSRYSVPTISPYREFVTAGGLMSYGGSVNELYRLVGVYTGRVLDGEKPADLPVQQVTKLELVINLRTAKALGLTVPPSLLARAVRLSNNPCIRADSLLHLLTTGYGTDATN